MKCQVCGGESFQRPEVPQAVEAWTCSACGESIDVHCHFLPGSLDLVKLSRSGRYQGSVIIETDDMRFAALLKLKRSLAFAERFSAASLETQYRSGSRHWDLGEFFDFELQRAEAECKKAGVTARFSKMVE